MTFNENLIRGTWQLNKSMVQKLQSLAAAHLLLLRRQLLLAKKLLLLKNLRSKIFNRA